MNTNKYTRILKTVFWEIIGSFLIAIGIYNFAVFAKFPMTGFSGISIILYRLFQIPIGVSTILLNIPVILLCFRLLGKGFLFRSVRCMILSSLIIDYIAPLLPAYAGNRMLAAVSTGVVSGLGYALIYMQNSSTGGTDFIIMGVKALKPYLSLGKITFLIDVVIILAGGILFSDVDGIIYGMIINFLIAVVIDKTMYGINAGKLALIVTEKGNEISDVIDTVIDRGSTLLKAKGGYRKSDKQVVMCACNNKQMYFLQKAIKEADPEAFIIVLESNEVHGEGFKMLQVGSKEEA